ncbi:uncharacterized protein SAPINGB_P002381 [Magnusiomyces paraingens]|uniref:Cas1p 10 TM acyl transferase domain-containing protein n=1 Tax=Magnusiomyces paraingens TaxID=2606893 RepID=A0A5E8BDK9_9ASCO|nr:uncharacterized protein SAPINGB_P002381 [Saprochaete ingens]VVT49663.1 unnamed protein product [Saprochaete ingens]
MFSTGTQQKHSFHPLLFLWALVAPLATFIILYFSTELQAHLERTYFVSQPLRQSNCDAVLKAGRYLDDPSFRPKIWQPDGCAMHPYTGPSALHDFTECFDPGDEIIVAGDSTARQVFYGLVSSLQPAQHYNISKREDLTVIVNGVSLRYFWSSYLDDMPQIFSDISKNGAKSKYKQVANSLKPTESLTRSKTHVFFTGGLWHAWYKTKDDGLRNYYKSMSQLFDIFKTAPNGVFDKVYFAPVMMPNYPQMTSDRWTFDVLSEMMNFTDTYFNFHRTKSGHGGPGGVVYKESGQVAMYYIPFTHEIGGEHHYGLYDQSGIHFNDIGRYLEPAILLNHMCNQVLADKKVANFAGTCCIEYPAMSRVAQIGLLAIITVALAAVIAASGKKAVIPLVTVLASVWAAGYVYMAERTHALSKIALHFEPAKGAILVQLGVLLAMFWPVLGGYGFKSGENLVVFKQSFPVGVLTKQLLNEFKGLCVAILLTVQVTGYDRVYDTYTGEVLARVFFSSYAMAEVYSLTLDVVERGSVRLYLRRLVHIFLLPGLIALALHHKDSQEGMVEKTQSAFQALTNLSPIAAKLFFWFSFVVVVVNLAKLLQVKFSQPLSVQAGFLIIAGAATFIARWATVEKYGPTQVTKTPAGTMINIGDAVYNKQHPILGDFWPVFAAFFAAWFGSISISNSSETYSEVVPSKKALVSVAAAAAIVTNALHRGLRFELPPLLIASNNRSYMDISADRYAEAILRRGHGYSTSVHGIVCMVFVLFWVFCRLALLHVTRGDKQEEEGGGKEVEETKVSQWRKLNYRYLGGFVWLAGCSYEVLVLRAHVLLAAGGTTLLYVLPTSTGATFSRLVERTLGLIAKDAPFKYFVFNGVLFAKVLEWVNLCVVVWVCLVVAVTVGAGWQYMEEEDEK